MYILSILLVIFLSSHTIDFCNAEDTLEAVFVFFRHGDRSPKESFPNDPYFNLTYWPMGFGQLTNYGINREYELGQWFRNRYSSFLSDQYSPEDLYVFATNHDRTIMSASLVLAGLYPPKGNQIWNPNLLWLPIPVHTTPTEYATIIVQDRNCTKYQKLLKETKESQYFQDINRNLSSLFQLIHTNINWEITDIEPIKWLHCNFFLAPENYNKNLTPVWAREHEQEFERVASLAFARDSHTDEMKKLHNGPFFNHLTTSFDKIINKNQTIPKFVLWSVHDSSLVAALNTMGAYDTKVPPFGAAIMWELRKNSNGHHYVNVLYKRKELEKIVVKNCEYNCEFNKFKNILKPFDIDIDIWLKECQSV